MNFSKYFLLLILALSSIVHAEKRNRFERIVRRYPHLSIFLASASSAAAGIYLYKKFDKPAAQDTQSLFQTNASLKRAAIAGAVVGTAIAAVADCGMPRFVPVATNRPVLYA